MFLETRPRVGLVFPIFLKQETYCFKAEDIKIAKQKARRNLQRTSFGFFTHK